MAWAVTLILSHSRAALTLEVPMAPQAHSGIQSAFKVGLPGPWEACSTPSSRFVLVFTPLPPTLAPSVVFVFSCLLKVGFETNLEMLGSISQIFCFIKTFIVS